MITRQSVIVGLLIAVTMGACDSFTDPTVTPTQIPIMTPSKTIAPLLPTQGTEDASLLNTPNITPVAPDATIINAIPNGTAIALQMQFTTDNGQIIAGTFYGAVNTPAPSILLLASDQKSWGTFPPLLRAAGYNVLTIDLVKAPSDVALVLHRMAGMVNVAPAKISVIGASSGANLALVECAQTQQCQSLVLISPGLEYQGIKAADSMPKYGNHPVMIIDSKSDNPSSPALDKLAQGDHQLVLFDGAVHGTGLFDTQPALAGQIIQWLKTHNG